MMLGEVRNNHCHLTWLETTLKCSHWESHLPTTYCQGFETYTWVNLDMHEEQLCEAIGALWSQKDSLEEPSGLY